MLMTTKPVAFLSRNTGESQYEKPLQNERERLNEGDELLLRYEGYTAVLANKFYTAPDGKLRQQKAPRGALQLRRF